MAVTNIRVRCWLCGELYLPEDMTPISIPEVNLEVTFDDGHIENIGTGSTIRPTCPKCVSKLSGLITYRGKSAL